MDKYFNHFHIGRHLHLKNFIHDEYNDLVIADSFRLLAISMVSLFIPIFLLSSSFSVLEVAFMELGLFLGAIVFHYLSLKFLARFGGVKKVMIFSYAMYILMYFSLKYTDIIVSNIGKVDFLILITFLNIIASVSYWTTHHIYFFRSAGSKDPGKKLGILKSVPTIAGIFSPFIGSILISNFSFYTTFLFSAVLMVVASSALLFSRDIDIKIDLSLKKSLNLHNIRTNIIFFIQGLGYAAVGFAWPILLFIFSIQLISMGSLYLFSNVVYAAISYFGGKRTDNDSSNIIGRIGAVGHGFSIIFRALSTTIVTMTAFQTMGGLFGGLVHISLDADFFKKGKKDIANAIMCREIYMNLGRAFIIAVLIILLFYFPIKQVFIGVLVFSGVLTFMLSILIKPQPINQEIKCCE